MLRTESVFARHLISGLKANGHRVTLIGQEGQDLSTLPTLGSRLITYRWHGWERLSMLQRMRLSGVIEELTAHPPDVLLVWGSREPAAIEMVQQATGIPTVVWCWDAAELFTPLIRMPQVRHVIVSSEAIRARVPAGFGPPVTLVRPGVYGSEGVACFDSDGHVPCLVCLDPLSNMQAYEVLVTACRQLADAGHDFLLFAFDTGQQEHPIWKLVERLHLLDRISFVPFHHEAEPLLLHGDLYLHVLPTSRVQYRTLEAMGRGLAVVTCPNSGADYLADGQTCRMVRNSTAEAWRDALAELLSNPAQAVALARQAQQLMRERHAMAGAIAQVASICHQAAGTPIKLAT